MCEEGGERCQERIVGMNVVEAVIGAQLRGGPTEVRRGPDGHVWKVPWPFGETPTAQASTGGQEVWASLSGARSPLAGTSGPHTERWTSTLGKNKQTNQPCQTTTPVTMPHS